MSRTVVFIVEGDGEVRAVPVLLRRLAPPPEPEAVRNAKGWLSERMPGERYREVSGQPALTAGFDLEDEKKPSLGRR
jgi:hypothetical protein